MEKSYLVEVVQRDCPLCDRIHAVEKRRRIGSMLIKGEPVQFEETYFFCPNCADDDENEFVPAELMDKNLQNDGPIRFRGQIGQVELTQRQAGGATFATQGPRTTGEHATTTGHRQGAGRTAIGSQCGGRR